MSKHWCHLDELAEVHLGYKSLQNDFFYVSRETIERFGIESHYLLDIFLLSDFDAHKFLQSPLQSTWLFYCRAGEIERRDVGAARYVQTMGKRPATRKKQSSEVQLTIRRALEEQGGGVWYAPKAMPQSANIWLRKAFAGVLAPFLFEVPIVVDQRCNRVVPRPGVEWRELASVMTSSLFALALEGDGGCSMGGGALEWPTRSLRRARVVDVRRFTPIQRSKLVKLAQRVWEKSTPVDFAKEVPFSKALLDLDEYVLKLIGRPVEQRELYLDLHSTVKMRIEKAKARKQESKVQEVADVRQVAISIASTIKQLLESRHFPEDFYSAEALTQVIEIPTVGDLTLTVERFMNNGRIVAEDAEGHAVFELEHSANTVEVVARAMLLGRHRFSIPLDETLASKGLTALFPWLALITTEIEEGVAASALGTRFEAQLREAILKELGISSSAFELHIWGSHHCAARA